MRIGRHMPLNGRPLRALEIASFLGCETIQLFASNPTGWKPPTGGEEAALEFAQAARARGLAPLVIHAPYLINLASPREEVWLPSIRLLAWTLQRAALLGASDVVVHIGSHRGAGIELGIARLKEALGRVLAEAPSEVRLLLENDVGAGHTLGQRFEELATVLALLPEEQERLGICLDTAHLWGAGYDIGSPAGVEAVLQRFSELVGLSRLKVLHFNDSRQPLGSHRDVHARVGEGQIPVEGLQALLNDTRLSGLTVVLETPIKRDEQDREDWEHDRAHLQYVKSLRALGSSQASPRLGRERASEGVGASQSAE
ncbi:MAG: deoxyribonuclease IV [Thermogemmatispora sp.]|uniref:deoxyribonuclease IV n=1 Tax=Thermogemmatispora sp. TaxID=1968838 RepID=UPI0019E13801|nr:deoxyribonuclease IV [Thermogemmatispora sp.]MBE3565145.1 deoxyribonuclease IV [Thermogemmatispora sp.]